MTKHLMFLASCICYYWTADAFVRQDMQKEDFSYPFCCQENEITLKGRKNSDAREMQSFYRHYYRKYIQALQNAADKDDR